MLIRKLFKFENAHIVRGCSTRRFLLASAASLALWVQATNAADTIQVTSSFSILGDLVQAVGGERVQVTTLVGPDQDAHTFEPKPSDAKTLLATQLLITNGLDFEPWATRLAKSAGFKGGVVVASQGVKARANDPQGSATYLQIMRHNVTQMVAGMKLN